MPEQFLPGVEYDFVDGRWIANTDPTGFNVGGNLGQNVAGISTGPSNFLGIEGMTNLDLGKLGLGGAQLGLGLASYLDNKKTAKKQRELLGQQIESNKYELEKRKDRAEQIGSQFGGGLASSVR